MFTHSANRTIEAAVLPADATGTTGVEAGDRVMGGQDANKYA
jgi:hypothetical protein